MARGQGGERLLGHTSVYRQLQPQFPSQAPVRGRIGYPVRGPVLRYFPSFVHLHRFTRQQLGAGTFAVMTAGAIAWYILTRKKIPPEELELQRRTLLAASGRITDGSIIGVDDRTEETSMDGLVEMPPPSTEQEPPHVLIYRYRHAGVTYECAQDVSLLADRVRNLRVDLPVQVRYDPHNPGDSILVSEEWSGLQNEPEPVLLPDEAESDPDGGPRFL